MRIVLVSLVVLASVLALSGPADAARVRGKATAESRLVHWINAVRKSHGLRRLRAVRPLNRAAGRHARSMGRSGYFRHELLTPRRSPRWNGFGRWIRWFYPGRRYSSWSAGENLAWGSPRLSARRTVKLWLRSPGHRANLLRRSWRNVGVSVVRVRNPRAYYRAWDDVTIVVAEFGRRSRR